MANGDGDSNVNAGQMSRFVQLAADLKNLAVEFGRLRDAFDRFTAEDREGIRELTALKTKVWFLEKVVYGTLAGMFLQALTLMGIGITWVLSKVISG